MLGLAAVVGFAIAATAKARGTDTHGRWPWLAAVAAPLATAALGAQRDRLKGDGRAAVWASLPVLLWHQTEEWVLPAGFLPWFNRSVWKSGDDEFPVTRGLAFRINVIGGWGLSAAAALGVSEAPWLGSAVLASHAANGALHLGAAIEQRSYNPGLVTALAMGPLGLLGATSMVSDPKTRTGAAVGTVLGMLASAALPMALRRRVRTAARSA